MKYPENFILFAGCSETHLEDAKKFCEKMGLSGDDVKIVVTYDKSVLVKTKREINFEKK